MAYSSVYSSTFQNTCKRWLEEQAEVLALVRYSHAAGARDYEFFTTYADLQNRIRELPPRTCVTVWEEPQLPLRGQVDAKFITRALEQIPEGSDWLLTGLEQVRAGVASWYRKIDGSSLADLAAELPDYLGERVAIGLQPAWAENGGKEVSTVVPETDGTVIAGIY